MKGALKSKHFWGGAAAVYIVLSVWPQLNGRALLARPKKG